MHEIVLIGDKRIVEIPVVESGNPVIDLSKEFPELQYDFDCPYVQKLSKKIFYARQKIGELLYEAQSNLPQGLFLKIKECYRPLWVQQKFWLDYVNYLQTKFPDWSIEQVENEASKYLAPLVVAAHPTGGAVDLVLADEFGVELDMGTKFNESPHSCQNKTYTHAKDISEEAQLNRSFLIQAMSKVGFINYPTEWWHWSYGDKYWAFHTKSKLALYSQIKVDFNVREAKLEDANAIAYIHSTVWKTTYKNLIHQSYLDKITPSKRLQSALARLQKSDLHCFVIEESETGKVVGFADFGPNRNKTVNADYELYAIYILDEFQGLGAGKQLLQFGVSKVGNDIKIIITVLEKNTKSRLFYENLGANVVHSNSIQIEDIPYPVVHYLLSSINFNH